MRPIRPVDPTDVKREITKVAEHQPEFQTLPAIFMKDKNICVSRWALEESEREMIRAFPNIFFYQVSNRVKENLCGHFLSSDFWSEKEILENASELIYSNRVFYYDEDNGHTMLEPTQETRNHAMWRYHWKLTEFQIDEILENNSIFIYQFNLKEAITPMNLSCGVPFVIE